MKKKYDIVKELEDFVRNSIIKLALLIVILIIVIKRDVYCGVIFVISSLLGYFRFHCMSGMFAAVTASGKKISYWNILSYFLTFFITIIFFKEYCLDHGKTCVVCGILGITIVSFGIIFGCISGDINKMSITKRR